MLQVVFASAERRLADRNHRPAGSLVYANEQSKGINQPPAPKDHAPCHCGHAYSRLNRLG